MKKKWLFIVNAAAGRGKTGKKINRLVEVLRKHNLDYEIELTKTPKHATELTIDAIKKGYRKIAAVGGDGTINEIVNGIMSSEKQAEITFAIIPEGGGNDFAKNFHIPQNIEKAVQLLEANRIKIVDVGKFDDTYFINSLGVGFDAKAAINASKIKYLNGLLRYYSAILITLFTNKPYKLKMRLDGEEISDELLMFSVGNGRFCGGGFQVTPAAIADDGLLDVCMIKFINRRRIMKLLPTVIPGKHLDYAEVSTKLVKSIEITSENDLPLYYDGEIPILKDTKKVGIEVIPQQIKLIVK
ncbi:MAG: diacylglycerol kinase family lipid kinase [Candidatus Cloacimonetes bacterium]|jgi:diacylglycerol kinase (ATP)|nr:diacylglycerol kinase family lipid kinase [Candidatus Cloacimonadota bacterium]MBT6994045.1 diacylglycerol kinase family lipid kinase [Candidatus Cloacimonadota bacterium]MBT7469632.1 diacylglycerol kinase family lipid kinase [Candidatus Cloacimonadota bacterium]